MDLIQKLTLPPPLHPHPVKARRAAHPSPMHPSKSKHFLLQSCNSLTHLLKTEYMLLDHLAALRVRYTGCPKKKYSGLIYNNF